MVRTHLAIAQGAQEAMEVNIQVFSTYYVPAFWSGVDDVSCSELLTLKIWRHDLCCLKLLNSNLQVLGRYNYIYVEQNTKAFM